MDSQEGGIPRILEKKMELLFKGFFAVASTGKLVLAGMAFVITRLQEENPVVPPLEWPNGDGLFSEHPTAIHCMSSRKKRTILMSLLVLFLSSHTQWPIFFQHPTYSVPKASTPSFSPSLLLSVFPAGVWVEGTAACVSHHELRFFTQMVNLVPGNPGRSARCLNIDLQGPFQPSNSMIL